MPARRPSAIQPEQFTTFGQLLRFLRQRAGLTQRELSIAAGYSESQMSRLEQNQRAPDQAALAARFVPALHLETEPEWAARLLELGAASRAAGQPEELAPAGEASFSPNNLPVQLTSFIGREAELAEIRQLFSGGARLITLTGPGGTGKTRLALEAAVTLLVAFPDGVWWVELAPLADPALIPQTVASVLGLKEEPDRPVLATVTDHLRHKRVLLILDNCEHLVQAAARLAEAVLRACPSVSLLPTSRELLGVGGERAFSVPSLRSPEPNEPLSPDRLRQYAAVRLFLDRAAATAPRFVLTPANAAAIVQICQRLDGIPLALELAAARLRMLPLEQLAARLDDVFRLLTGGSRTALPRHQTLTALIDWSYDLLPPPEKALLRRLAVFAGGWTLEAAEAVCAGAGLESGAVADLLSHLIDKSLVLVEERAGVARYRLMETVRQYAQSKLAASGEADDVRQRHARYYTKLVEAATQLSTAARLDLFDSEQDNLRGAVGWSQVTPGQLEFALLLAPTLAWYAYFRGRGGADMRLRLPSILAQTEAANFPNAQAVAVLTLGHEIALQGDYGAGEAHIAESLSLFQNIGDRSGMAWALDRLAWVQRERGDAATARARSEASLALRRELQDQVSICNSINTLAETMTLTGDLVAAKAMLEENLILARQLADNNLIGWALNHLGHIAQLQSDYQQARQLHLASLLVFHELGARGLGHVWAHQSLGETALAQGDAWQAVSCFVEALVVSRDLGDRAVLAWCLAGLAGAAGLDEEPERAAWLWGAGEKLRLSLGAREAPCAHATHERLKAQAREQLGEPAFSAEWAAGGAAPLSEAIERALS
jgi:predicted ATPase